MPIATLRSAKPILRGTYSFVQVGIEGTHGDVWPGSGEAHPIAGTAHRAGFQARTAQIPRTAIKHPTRRRSIAWIWRRDIELPAYFLQGPGPTTL
jgi:hypothetical protein